MGLPEYVLYDIFSVFILLFRPFLRVFFAPFPCLRSVHSRPLPCILYITDFGILCILNVSYQSIAQTTEYFDVQMQFIQSGIQQARRTMM